MKFIELTVNQRFYLEQYPNCFGIKQQYFGGSCCTPAFNAKIICQNPGQPVQEKAVLLNDYDEVVVIDQIPIENVTKENTEQASTQTTPSTDPRTLSGYEWHGHGPDPSLIGGGSFG